MPIWHRRAGKTTAVVNDLGRDLIDAQSFMPAVAYVAPLRNQAKRVAWPLVQHYLRDVPGARFDQAELVAYLPGDRRFFVLGADNPDAIRGIGLVAAGVDETGQIDPAAWFEVLLPALAENDGKATLIGTPKGRANLLFELQEEMRGQPEWWVEVLKASESKVLKARQLRDLQRQMPVNEYEQEMECSFNAAITGSYYAKEMAAAEEENRITTVHYDNRFPVLAALDLGWSDLLVAWYAQLVGNELRVLGCDAWRHTKLPDMVADMRELPFPVHQVIAPPDIKVTELGTGQSRLEVLWQSGANVLVCPAMAVHDGIEAVRDTLPRAVFDFEGCQVGVRPRDQRVYGIEALVQYRTEYDSVLRVYKRTHVHDWASHYADAFRYLVVGLPYAATAFRNERRRAVRRRRGRVR